MYIKVDNLQVMPVFIRHAASPVMVEISWEERQDNMDGNPIKYELNIHPQSPLFFVDDAGKLSKVRKWVADITGNGNRREKIRVQVPGELEQLTTLRLDAINSFGVKSHCTVAVMYK